MRLTVISFLFAAATVGVSGLAPQRQVLVTYPKDTPESTIDSAKDSIMAAGGQIIAEFNLIKYFPQSEGSVMHESNNWRRGFAAKASTQALEAIHSLSMKYVPTVEDDNIVTTQDE